MSAGIDRDQLRLLVREVVRDAMTAQGAPVPPRPASAPAPAGLDTPPPTGPLAADRRSRTDTVRIGSDAELGTFVRNLLQLFENPKTRADLRAGRLTFRLAGTPRGSGAGPTAPTATRRSYEARARPAITPANRVVPAAAQTAVNSSVVASSASSA